MSGEYQKQVEFDRLPIGINHAYIHKCTSNGRLMKFPSKQAKEWREEIGWAFKQPKPLKGNFGVEIIVEMHDKRRRDIDSGVKFILDALNKIVWEDDDQVIETHLYKSRGHKNPKTIISVWALD